MIKCFRIEYTRRSWHFEQIAGYNDNQSKKCWSVVPPTVISLYIIIVIWWLSATIHYTATGAHDNEN